MKKLTVLTLLTVFPFTLFALGNFGFGFSGKGGPWGPSDAVGTLNGSRGDFVITAGTDISIQKIQVGSNSFQIRITSTAGGGPAAWEIDADPVEPTDGIRTTFSVPLDAKLFFSVKLDGFPLIKGTEWTENLTADSITLTPEFLAEKGGAPGASERIKITYQR